MSSFPPTAIAEIDGAVQEGRGAAASVLGDQDSYTVYRLSNTTNNSMLSGTPIFTGFPAYLNKAKNTDLENVTFNGLEAFAFTCDNRNLQLGDLFVDGGGGQYIFAQHRALKPSIFMRVERNVNITRPNPLGGSASQQPVSGAVKAGGYIGVTQGNEEFLTLTNGVYLFASTGLMASVPFGLQPMNRIRGPHKPDFPTQVEETQFLGYLPMMPGVQIIENDIINSDSGDRYRVAQPFQSDDIGLQGYILILKKMNV